MLKLAAIIMADLLMLLLDGHVCSSASHKDNPSSIGCSAGSPTLNSPDSQGRAEACRRKHARWQGHLLVLLPAFGVEGFMPWRGPALHVSLSGTVMEHLRDRAVESETCCSHPRRLLRMT